MSTKKEDVKKKQQEELEEERQRNLSKKAQKKETETYQAGDTLSNSQKKDLPDMISDYEKKFPGRQVSENGTLTFDKGEAIEFFREQANKTPPQSFDMTCKEPDQRVYSDGKGIFVQGTNKDVEAYIKNPGMYTVNKEDGSLKMKELAAGQMKAPTSTSSKVTDNVADQVKNIPPEETAKPTDENPVELESNVKPD